MPLCCQVSHKKSFWFGFVSSLKGKLLTHKEALNYYQSTLTGTLDIGGGTGFSRPTIGMTGVNDDAELIAKAQMRNIAMAFQADITRTASFQFMGAQDESLKINFPSVRPYMGDFGSGDKLNYNETRSHVSSHNEFALFDSQTRWYNMMVAYLMDELAVHPDVAYGAIQNGKAIDAMNNGMSNLYLDIAKAFVLNWNRYGNSYGGIGGFLR